MSIAVINLRSIRLLVVTTLTAMRAACALADDHRDQAMDRQSFIVQVGSKVRTVVDDQTGRSATPSSKHQTFTILRLETTVPLVLHFSSDNARRQSSAMTPLLLQSGRTTIELRSLNTDEGHVDSSSSRTVRVDWPESDRPVLTIAAP